MNVYDQISSNSRKTVLILLVFPIALFVTLFLFAILFVKIEGARASITGEALQYTLMVFPWLSLVAFIWIAVSFYMGGSMILGMANAHRVTFEENRDLFRLVENTAIMAGLPTPEIYLIDDDSLNAFATGRDPQTGIVALTRGIVKKLDKDELQAVIAHELAHIGNRDTRLMIITVAGIGCFLFLGEILLRSAFRGAGRGRGRGSGKGTLVIIFLAVACFVFGYVIAPILRLALSRRREYQADATAAKITRDPDALARALKKIAINPRVEALDASPLVGNMCIANPAKPSFFRNLYCTHPQIEDRLAALGKMTGGSDSPQSSAPAGKAIW